MLKDYIEKMKEDLNALEDDVRKFDEKGMKAAGARVRKAFQQFKKDCQSVRVYILDTIKRK